jgi:hypothetical protein
MTLTVLQIIVLIFAAFAWSRVLLQLKKKNVVLGEFLFWTIVWAGVVVVVVFPGTISGFLSKLGIENGIMAIVYLSIIALFYMIFRMYSTIDRHERDLTKMVREIAIREAKKKK